LLARLGRSTAFELWAVRADNHIVVDVSDSLQVVAMGRTSREKLCPDDARAAVRMLTLGGTALQEEVVRVRILTDMESESGVLVRQCTSLSQVIRFFQKMCFVWVRPAHYPPLPTFTARCAAAHASASTQAASTSSLRICSTCVCVRPRRLLSSCPCSASVAGNADKH
jgi:hypothetical protein